MMKQQTDCTLTVRCHSIRNSGFLKCRATKIGEDTTLSKIIKMVSDASASKADNEQNWYLTLVNYNIETGTWEKRTEKWKEMMVGVLGSEEAFYYQFGTQFSASDQCLVSRECLAKLRDKAVLWEPKTEELQELYNVMNDGQTPLEIIDMMVASYRNLFAQNNPYANEVHAIIEMKKNNPGFHIEFTDDGACYKESKKTIYLEDLNPQVFHHELGHAFFDMRYNKYIPEEFLLYK